MEGMPETVMDDAATDAVVNAAPPPARAKRAAAEPPAERSVVRDMEREDDRGVRDWIDTLAGDTAIKVCIRRQKPVIGPHGENIGGLLETAEDKIDEEYISEVWGGGTFLLQVQTPTAGGKWKYFRGKTVKIAGPPKMHGQLLAGPAAAAPIGPAEDTLAERAFATMERNALEAQKRVDRIESSRGGGMDFAALRELNAPLVEQLANAQKTISDLQQQMMAITSRPPPKDEFRDQLLARAITDDRQRIGDETARIEALRAQYEARIDRMRDNHEDQIKRLEERLTKDMDRVETRHSDEIRRLEARHERDLKMADKQGETTGKAQDTANQARIDALNAEKERLGRELTAAQARIGALEAKKDQTISEKADELIKVKEALDGIGGGDEADKKWYEKLFDVVGNSEAAIKLIEKLGVGGGPGGQPGSPDQLQLPPPGIPFQTGDGNVYVRDAAGNVGIVNQNAGGQPRQRQAGPKRKRPAGAPGAPQQAANDEIGEEDEAVVDVVSPGRPPKPDEVRMAVNFMENALKAGTSPERFAQTARNLVPGDVLSFIQRVGIDAFLDKVVEPGSGLATIRGRQFARAVAKVLVGGDVPVALPERPEEE